MGLTFLKLGKVSLTAARPKTPERTTISSGHYASRIPPQKLLKGSLNYFNCTPETSSGHLHQK